MTDDITIRHLTQPQQMQAAVDLQKEYWGEAAENLVPGHMLLSLAKHGGPIIGAYLNERLVGLSIGFIGTLAQADSGEGATDKLVLMSKRALVTDAMQGRGIGEKLKQAQYDYAVALGIKLITWTFDPLLARNAYFNLRKLGAVVQSFVQDPYSAVSAGDVGALAGDRLVANWWVGHRHVQDRSEGDYYQRSSPLIRTRLEDGLLKPDGFYNPTGAEPIVLQIPRDISEVDQRDPALGQVWRGVVREAFTRLLARGYIVMDFWRMDDERYYVFREDDGTFRF